MKGQAWPAVVQFYTENWNFSAKLFVQKVTITRLLTPVASQRTINRALLFADKQFSVQYSLQLCR